MPKAVQAEALASVAQLLQIAPLLQRKPGQLSGGQRQRVAMGRALVRDPLLFLFDEPLSNLDAKLRVEMRTEIKKLHQKLGKTTIYVTHDQVEAMTLASRIAVMHQGVLRQFAEPRTVYDRPADMFVAAFMGSPAMNFIPAVATAGNGGAALAIGNNGSVAALALPPGNQRGSLEPGRRVVLGVRPEHLSVHDSDRRGRQQAALAQIEAPVEVVEPTGAETIVVVRVGEREVIARLEPDEAPKVGERVRLAVDMSKACLFDPETERLIA